MAKPQTQSAGVHSAGVHSAGVEVYVSLGSNIAPVEHLRQAYQELAATYGELHSSHVYRTAAVGFDGDDFLNMVIGFHTREKPQAVLEHIEEMHDTAERVRTDNPNSPRTLDVDLLLYGSMVSRRLNLPHGDIDRYAFVAGPLAELAPDLRHPVSGKTMAELWAGFDAGERDLQPVDIGLN